MQNGMKGNKGESVTGNEGKVELGKSLGERGKGE